METPFFPVSLRDLPSHHRHRRTERDGISHRQSTRCVRSLPIIQAFAPAIGCSPVPDRSLTSPTMSHTNRSKFIRIARRHQRRRSARLRQRRNARNLSSFCRTATSSFSMRNIPMRNIQEHIGWGHGAAEHASFRSRLRPGRTSSFSFITIRIMTTR